MGANVEDMFTVSSSLQDWGCEHVSRRNKAVRNSLTGAMYVAELSAQEMQREASLSLQQQDRTLGEPDSMLHAESGTELKVYTETLLDTTTLAGAGGYGEDISGKTVTDGSNTKKSNLKKEKDKMPEPKKDECPSVDEVKQEDEKTRKKVWEDPKCATDCPKADYGFCVVKTKQGAKNKKKLKDDQTRKKLKGAQDMAKKVLAAAKKKGEKLAKEIKIKKAKR